MAGFGGTRKTPVSLAVGCGGGREEGGGGADGHGGARQQGGAAEHFAGAAVGVGVGDDDAVDELGAGREHGGVVGRVDGLGQVAPAGQGGDTVLAEVLDGGQDVGAGRQQAAVAEGAQDAGVVGGRGPQLEQLPLGRGHVVVEQLAQRVGVAVELLGGEGAVGGRGAGLGGEATLGWHPGVRRRFGQAEQLGQAPLRAERLRGAALGFVRALGRGRGVRRAGGGQLRTGLVGGGLPGLLGGLTGGLPGRLVRRHGGLLCVARGERGAGGVGVRGGVVEPAGTDRLGGLLLDLGQALAQVPGFAAGALGLGGGGGGVAVGGLAGLLEDGGALLLLVGDPLALLRRGVEGPYELDGGLGACREGGCRVPLGLLDGGGHPRGAVGGGAVAQHGLGGLPGGVQGAGVVELAALGGGGLLGGGERQGGVPVGDFGGDERAATALVLGVGDGVGGGRDLSGQLDGAAALLGAARGQAAGQHAGAALGAGVDAARLVAPDGGFRDAGEQVEGASGEVPLGGELGPAAQLVGEAVHEVGEAVGVAGVGDRAQQQVGEVGVVLDGEEAGGLALVGVHLALVAEEFGVEAELAEVFVPALVDLLPHHVQMRVGLASLGEGVAEALHGAAAAAGPGGTVGTGAHRRGLGDGQRVEAEPRAGAEGVPGLGELARVVGDLAAAPFADLADDDALAGEHVLPLQGDVPAVVGEQELAQHAGAGAAQGVAVARQHHREDQLEQDGLAAAVLQEEHACGGRGGAAGRRARPRRTPPARGAGFGTGAPTPRRSSTVSA
ncbi:hypothetical protein GCM10020000_68680 [Streptomyces olivoverticillatus]